MSEYLEDLLIDSSESFEDGNYFLVTITELELGTTYPLEFRWKYKDGTLGKDWSAVYNLNTPVATVPGDPQLQVSDVVGGGRLITVTWSGNDASGNPLNNIDRVDIHISGTSFGDGTKPAGFFKESGTQTFTAEPGVYIVQLKAVTVNGETSFFSDARTVTVTDVGETIQSPTTPNGFSSKRILAGIEVTWNGTYSDSTFTGFEAINIYAGNSASATSGTYEQVGVLTGNNVKNTIVVPLGTYVVYGQAVYIHAAAVNKNGTVGTIQANVTNQTLGPGKATDADINDGAVVISKLAADVLTVGNLKAGDINSTSYIRAGTAGSARVEISSSTVGSVLPGLTVYDSSGTQLLRAPLTGGLTINGGGTFSGNLSAAGGTFTGTLSAASGSFSGTITASGGTIGGITIAAAALQNNSVESSSTFKLDSAGKARFGAFSGNAIIINPAANIGSAYLFHSANGGSSASDKFSFLQSGGFRLGGSSGINYDGSTSLTIGSSGNPITINTSTGAVSISGVITAGNLTDGTTTISGDNITTGTITGRTVQTSTGSNAVILNGSNNSLQIKANGSIISHIVNFSSTGTVWHHGSTPDTNGFSYPQAKITAASIDIAASNSAYFSASGAGNTVVGSTIYSGGTHTFSGAFVANSTATFNSTMFAPNLSTSTSATNLRVATGSIGEIQETSASSIRYKENVQNLILSDEVSPNNLLNLPVRSFTYKSGYVSDSDDRYNKILPGFIAEEVEEHYPIAVDYAEGQPHTWNERFIIPGMLALIQNLNQELISVKSRLDALEG
jgi:hypothetical protein